MLVEVHCPHCRELVDEDECWDKDENLKETAETGAASSTMESEENSVGVVQENSATDQNTAPIVNEEANADTAPSEQKRSFLRTWGPRAVVAGAAVGGVGVAGAAVCYAATAAGFGTAGVVGGSYMAATQAAMGNVAAGSWFALGQSLGATGCFASGASTGVVAASAGTAVAGGTQLALRVNKTSTSTNECTSSNSQPVTEKGIPSKENDPARILAGVKPGDTGRLVTCNHCNHLFAFTSRRPAEL